MKIKNIHIILFMIILIIIRIGLYEFNRFQINNAYENNNSDLSINDYYIESIYEKNPNVFNFGEDGECIITVSELLKYESEYEMDILHDKYGNDCIGYYIIHKDLDNNIDIDSSHICEMIDY